MNDISPPSVRVRFCPSPTGTPHVGMIRTALFNWAYARHTGGTFVFRIEDTDAARDSQESYEQLLEALSWLGLTWDEGPDVGGPHAPYRQSERGEIYQDVINRLIESGHVYDSFSTPEEVEARHRQHGRDPKLGYDNYDRHLHEDVKQTFREEGRPSVLRLRMPDEDITFDDLIRGPVTFKAGSVPDFAVVRATGEPLYTLVNPVDDALMGITHVLRGEDLLSSTPRQVALYQALIDIGVAKEIPRFGHLPYVMGQGNKKLSKRDPESNLFLHREHGMIPEGLINYLALLGWSIAEDRDIFSVEEFVAAFDIVDVNANPARFDEAKCTAINAEHIRRLEVGDFTERLRPYLQLTGHLPVDPSPAQLSALNAAAPLIQTRIQVLGEASGMIGFLFVDDARLVLEDDALAAVTKDVEQTRAVLAASSGALAELDDWSTVNLEAALRGSLVEGLGIKPKFAFTPLRVAVTGRRVSPPLFESMEILGKEASLRRIRALAGRLDA